MSSQTENPKEAATKLAITQGMALIRRHHEIIGIRANGDEVLIVAAESKETAWQEALDVLQPAEQEESAIKNDDETTTNFEHLSVYTDGGSRGNPGPSASGYVIMTTEKDIIDEGGEYLGVTTNNQAEYQAVKLALEKAQVFNPKQLDFFIDSLLVVNQMNGKWKIKNRDLWPIHEAIKELAEQYEKVTFTHVRREFNALADEQVNIVLDEHQDSE